MFSALIFLNFLPWSILNLKEKSGGVILAEFNSFPSHVVNNPGENPSRIFEDLDEDLCEDLHQDL